MTAACAKRSRISSKISATTNSKARHPSFPICSKSAPYFPLPPISPDASAVFSTARRYSLRKLVAEVSITPKISTLSFTFHRRDCTAMWKLAAAPNLSTAGRHPLSRGHRAHKGRHEGNPANFPLFSPPLLRLLSTYSLSHKKDAFREDAHNFFAPRHRPQPPSDFL